MPLRGELPLCAELPSKTQQVWAWAIATITNPEFCMVALFCAVGLWMTFYFMHRFPNSGDLEPIFLLP